MKGGQDLGVSAEKGNIRKWGKQIHESRTERKQFIVRVIAYREKHRYVSDKCLKDVMLVGEFASYERWS